MEHNNLERIGYHRVVGDDRHHFHGHAPPVRVGLVEVVVVELSGKVGFD